MPTSRLQQKASRRLFNKYKKYGIVENTRPIWLISSKGERLELDFYIEKLNVAVEVQGKQHLEFTPIFHGSQYDFEEQLRRDKDKKDKCYLHDVTLLYILDESDIDAAVYEIDSVLNNRLDSDSWFVFSKTSIYSQGQRLEHNGNCDVQNKGKLPTKEEIIKNITRLKLLSGKAREGMIESDKLLISVINILLKARQIGYEPPEHEMYIISDAISLSEDRKDKNGYIRARDMYNAMSNKIYGR